MLNSGSNNNTENKRKPNNDNHDNGFRCEAPVKGLLLCSVMLVIVHSVSINYKS